MQKLRRNYAEITHVTQKLRKNYAEITQKLRKNYAKITQKKLRRLRKNYACVCNLRNLHYYAHPTLLTRMNGLGTLMRTRISASAFRAQN